MKTLRLRPASRPPQRHPARLLCLLVTVAALLCFVVTARMPLRTRPTAATALTFPATISNRRRVVSPAPPPTPPLRSSPTACPSSESTSWPTSPHGQLLGHWTTRQHAAQGWAETNESSTVCDEVHEELGVTLYRGPCRSVNKSNDRHVFVSPEKCGPALALDPDRFLEVFADAALIFAGDSVTAQQTAALVCALARFAAQLRHGHEKKRRHGVQSMKRRDLPSPACSRCPKCFLFEYTMTTRRRRTRTTATSRQVLICHVQTPWHAGLEVEVDLKGNAPGASHTVRSRLVGPRLRVLLDALLLLQGGANSSSAPARLGPDDVVQINQGLHYGGREERLRLETQELTKRWDAYSYVASKSGEKDTENNNNNMPAALPLLLWRETSPQHFRGGVYGNSRADGRCYPFDSEAEIEGRSDDGAWPRAYRFNAHLSESLGLSSSSSSSRIPVVRIWRPTALRPEAHFPHHPPGDCTHICDAGVLELWSAALVAVVAKNRNTRARKEREEAEEEAQEQQEEKKSSSRRDLSAVAVRIQGLLFDAFRPSRLTRTCAGSTMPRGVWCVGGSGQCVDWKKPRLAAQECRRQQQTTTDDNKKQILV